MLELPFHRLLVCSRTAPSLDPDRSSPPKRTQSQQSARKTFVSLFKAKAGLPSTGCDSDDRKLFQTKDSEWVNKRRRLVRGRASPLGLTSGQPRTGKKSSEEYHKAHLRATYQGLKLVQSLPELDPALLASKRVTLPILDPPKKTVVFDLDETLVHRCAVGVKGDLSVKGPLGTLEFNIRPYARRTLSAVKQYFEVIVFTASHQNYAEPVLNCLDPNNDLIDHRLYRQHCVKMNRVFLKDLRILGNRRIQDIVIVDNAVQSFAMQLSNGIPIISWSDDKQDKELLHLTRYLKKLAYIEDVRTLNASTFKLSSFVASYSLQQKNRNPS